ncbi:hypothetical protein BXO88_10705 [Oribacterium sp. C9]|nr:hypothetical protein BXO88_10705 [Oribacterium sp. C9]
MRLSPDEYQVLENRVIAAGVTQQAYIINAITNAKIVTSDEIEVLKDISMSLSDLVRQIRGMANNLNQITKFMNSTGVVPGEAVLKEFYKSTNEFRTECDLIWQSIRSSIVNRQKPKKL